MKSLKTALVITLTALSILSCKKDDKTTTSPTPSQTTTQKVQYKWTFVSAIDFNYVGTTTTLDYIDTIAVGDPGDYVEFRTDNKAYLYTLTTYDTLEYSVINDNLMVFNSDTFNITVLTANDFTLTYSERTVSPYFDNVIKMRK